MSTTFLFPGQGSQYPNMLHNLPKYTEISKVIEEASETLHIDVFSLDTNEALKNTTAVQLSLLISEVAVAKALKSEDIFPSMVAGHSVGSFAAAVIAGALKFSDALNLVKLRGSLMSKAYPEGYGMGVVIGIDEKRITNLIEQIRSEGKSVYVANINAYKQITVAGEIKAIESVLIKCRSNGAYKTEILNISVPSHCILLKSVSDKLNTQFEKIQMYEPDITYISNVKARALKSSNEIKNDLIFGVSNPVRWHEVTRLLYELGTNIFLEATPGRVLTSLAKEAFKEVRCISLEDMSISSAALLIKKNRR